MKNILLFSFIGSLLVSSVSAQTEKAFNRMDKDDSATLSVDEFVTAVMKQQRARHQKKGGAPEDFDAEKAEKRTRARFKKLDLNQDEKLSVEEFLTKPTK